MTAETARTEDGALWRRPLLAPWVAGIVALLIRIAYILDLRSVPLFEHPIMDAAVHDGWARGTLRLFFEDIPYFRAPLYPWFLGWLYAVDGGYLWPRLVQALLSALTVVLVADLGRRLFGGVAGLAGGLLLALCWPVIYFSGELLIVTFFAFGVMGALWFLVRAGLEDRPVLALPGALVVGLASIARPTLLVLLPMLLLLPLWIWRGAERPRLSRGRAWLAVAMVVLALLPGLGLTVRNQVVGEDWVFIASQGGVNFYIGNNPQSDGRTAVVPGTRATWLGGYEDTVRMAQQEAGRPLRPSEVSDHFYRKGLRFWVEEPGRALGLTAHKLRLLLGASERSNNQNIHFWRAQSSLLSLPLYTSWAVLFAFGLTGLILGRRPRASAPVWGFLALYSLVLVLFFVNERFRTPLTVVWAVFAGVPVAQGIAAARARRWRPFALVLGLSLGLFLLSSLDRIGFKESRTDADAFSLYTLGNAYAAEGRYDEALSSYDRSLEVAERFGLRHFEATASMLRVQRLRVLREKGDYEQLKVELEALPEELAKASPFRVLWGQYYLWMHQYHYAFPHFRTVVNEEPENVEALLGLAWCQAQNKAWSPAERSFRKVLQLWPGNPEAVAGLGVVELSGRQNVAKARQYLERALKKDPTVAVAHQYMADIYRSERDTPNMLWHLREALRLDPNNARVRRFLTRMGAPLTHPTVGEEGP